MRNLIYSILSFLLVFGQISCDQESSDKSLSEKEENYLNDYQSPEYLWGFVDREGNEAIEAIYDDARDFNEGMAAVNFKGYWGFINSSGQFIIHPSYRSVYNFSEGYCVAQTFTDTFLILDKAGIIVQKLAYQEVLSVASSRIRVKDKHGYIYLDLDGNSINQEVYDQAFDFENGQAIVGINEKHGMIDSIGNTVLPLIYQQIVFLNKNFVKVREENGRYKLYELSDRKFYPEEYISIISSGQKSIALLNVDETWQIYDPAYHKFYSVPYKNIYPGGEGKWMYREDGKFGMLNQEGQKITESEYDAFYRFSENRCVYKEGNFWGYLREDGNKLTSPVFPLAWDFKNGLARIIANGGIGFIDLDGNIKIPPKFIEIRDFQEGLSRFQKYW